MTGDGVRVEHGLAEEERVCLCGRRFHLWSELHDHVLANPNTGFCDQCSGPFDGWLEQYGGHWDSCPNRVETPPAPKHYAVRDAVSGAVYPQPNRLIAEKVAEWHGHCEVIETPPADDVRESLIRRLRGAHEFTPNLRTLLREAADYIAAFEGRPRGPVTDAAVDRAMREFHEHSSPGSRAAMRAALEAAREVQP